MNGYSFLNPSIPPTPVSHSLQPSNPIPPPLILTRHGMDPYSEPRDPLLQVAHHHVNHRPGCHQVTIPIRILDDTVPRPEEVDDPAHSLFRDAQCGSGGFVSPI